MQPSVNQPRVAVIENILVRESFESVWLGDIFLSEESLTYIPYGLFRSSAPVAFGAAAVFGGLTGVLSTKLLEGSVADVTPAANKARIREWGLSTEERVAKHKGTIAIPRSEIQTFETEGGLTIKTPSGTRIFGSLSDDGAKWVRDRMKGEFGLESGPIEDLSALFLAWHSKLPLPAHLEQNAGLQNKLCPPATAVDYFKNGNTQAFVSALKEAEEDGLYMARFFALFQTLSGKIQKAMLPTLASMSATVRKHVVSYLERRSAGHEKTPFISLPILTIAIAVSLAAVFSGKEFFEIVFFVIIAGLFALFAGIRVLMWVERRGFAKQLQALRQGEPSLAD